MLKRDKRISGFESIKQLLAAVPDLYNLRIHHALSLKVPPSWKIEDRRIDDFHLLFVRGGRGTYHVNDQQVDLERGRMVFVGGSARYSSSQDIDNPPVIMPIRFGFYSRKTGKQLPPINEDIHCICRSANIGISEFMFQEISRLHSQKDPFSQANAVSLLHSTLCHTLQIAAEHNEDNHRQLEKIKKWMTEYPLDRSTIDILARKAGLSKKYFSKLFRNTYGMSPKHYQLLQRMDYAKYLLRESKDAIKEIAYFLGYGDQYTFSRQFTDITGLSPSEFRKQQK